LSGDRRHALSDGNRPFALFIERPRLPVKGGHNALAIAGRSGYHAGMRRIAHCLLSWVMAFSLVASAAAWNQCTAMQLGAANAASYAHQAAPAKHDHALHDHASQDHHAAQDNTPAAPAFGDPICMTCCAMCVLASATLPAVTGTAMFAVSAAVFFSTPESWSNSAPAVDPVIPQPIA
jgi:hypothetical protein